MSLPPLALADGPHWQLPNPDGDDGNGGNGTPEDDSDDPELKNKQQPNGPAPLNDFDRNPGSFVLLDDKAREYYSRHCGVPAVAPDKTRIYVRIIHRAAQVMREVDTYLPCQDSFPLWHTERRRERMVNYAVRTWARVREIPPESAAACAELAVDCYVDSIRFAGEARQKDGALKQFFELHREMRNLATRMASGKDTVAQRQYWAGIVPLQRMLPQLTKEFKTFGPLPNGAASGLTQGWQALLLSAMTGDIPVQIDDTESRMREGLLKMGPVALKPLLKYTKHPNPNVAKAISTLYTQIAGQAKTVTYNNVLDLVQTIAREPNSEHARLAADVLREMKTPALPYLVRMLHHEDTQVRDCAIGALTTLTGQRYERNEGAWRNYVDALIATQTAKKGDGKDDRARNRKKAGEDLDEDATDNFEIKKRPGYVEPIDDE